MILGTWVVSGAFGRAMLHWLNLVESQTEALSYGKVDHGPDRIAFCLHGTRLSHKLPINSPKKFPIKGSESCYYIFKVNLLNFEKVDEKIPFFFTYLQLNLVSLRFKSCIV